MSKQYGKFKDGKCPYKKNHKWKECPTNKWGLNEDKNISAGGETLLCTVTEMMDTMYDDEDHVLCMYCDDDSSVDTNDGDIDSNLVNPSDFYFCNNLYSYAPSHLDPTNRHDNCINSSDSEDYIFGQDTDVCREEASPILSQAKGSIDMN